ncbi:MAG: bifunctional phosphopantothenoylcysteine decarboxylase/phosphopantothenate--cysteine ligase CoaBC [Candidatus Thermoplasmatota archaeon]|nr:bifunctional phosphopantothenoylcysteine decarboxylase/phosphopantothenate--cysteine ligase CoaBC [Euryarchaeota archaeon]MBU4033086.1 bifunctional phosphopantothenoylcysteine decarboxylase/phosphopantothenate--cysteine ligase CoaBC [Candidatus Thermoplasmatota archaeon]MBU4072320.1 bifunctional phosphopantothenoylcysteine decarboxylase/phosphopantothenate--cysteine ligase CoaBC [Candidatus Thermoplasmatota archaeon]MBU4143360.1 bifunctional phosphopantothenoylcysteine decarboxylase/phosphopa
MHPINEIRGTAGSALKGKRIVLGITGSIAAVEDVKLARELARHGADVIPVMSKAATKLVHPDAIHFATGHEPIIELDGAVKHVELCGDSKYRADVLLIAPATANTISKIAHGIDDTSVTTMASCAMGSGMPIIIVPAMHGSMYNHDIIMENVDKLKSKGVIFVGPRLEEKKAKMATQDDIVWEVMRAAGPKNLVGKKVLIISGSTKEPIDDVRFISNKSSGRTGLALAVEAYRRGAEVELWTDGKAPAFAKCKTFTSVADLEKMSPKAVADIIIVPAAISDFKVKPRKGKTPSGKPLTVTLEPAPKILGLLKKKNRILVGFKAETGITGKELESRAMVRMKLHNLDLIVANLLEDVGLESTKAILIGKKILNFKGTRTELAEIIFDMLEA